MSEEKQNASQEDHPMHGHEGGCMRWLGLAALVLVLLAVWLS